MKTWHTLIALLAGVGASTSATGQPTASAPISPTSEKAIARFDAGDRAYAKLQALNDLANDLDDQPSGKRDVAAVHAAWTAAAEEGLRTMVRGTRIPHPLAGRALIALAIMKQVEGDNAAGLALAQRGQLLISPFRDHYPNIYVQGLSIIGFLQAAAGRPAEGAATLADGVAFYDRYFERLKPERRTRELYMAKSNGEFSYASALSKLGQNERAVDFQRRSMESRVAGLGENHPDTISAYYNYALMLMRAGRVDAAEAEARKAVERAIEHVDPKHTSYARSLEALALILSRNGSRTESIEYLRRSLDIKRKTIGPSNLNYHAGLLNVGDILLQLERYDEARRTLTEAAVGSRAIEGPASHQATRAAAFAGMASFADGRPGEAANELASLIAATRTRDAREREIGRLVLPDLILAKIATGSTEEARALAKSFVGEVNAFDDAQPFLLAHADALRAYADRGSSADWEARARSAARRIVTIVRDNRSLIRDGQLPQRERAALDLALRIAVAARDPALGLDAMVVLAGSKIAQANRLLVQRLADADPQLAGRVRALQDRVKAFQDADVALLKALAANAAVAEARAAQEAAQKALSVSRADMARDFPRWVEARGAEAVDLPTLQAQLAPDEGMLGVIPAYDGVYVLAITRDAALVHRTALGRTALMQMVTGLRQSLSAGSFDAVASHAVHAQLFTREVALIFSRTKSLRIVPTGAFASMPFATLLEKPARAGRRADYLLRRYAITIAPGFHLDRRSSVVAQRGSRFLGIGAPSPFPAASTPASETVANVGVTTTNAAYFRGGAAASTVLASLPPLPAAERELQTIARQLGSANSTLLVGGDAREAKVRSMDLTPYSIMVFATHGLVAGEMEGVAEPALVLAPPTNGDGSDGLLSASEIGMLRLDADWVILSACNTAAGDGALAPAYSGLAQAFRYAGARSMLLSHWPVRDDAAASITVKTIAAAARGERRDVALQRAMLALIDDRKIADGADPFVWAPYVLLD